MEIKKIKYIIANLFKKFFVIFKESKSLPHVWSYILLSIILTFVFFIFTFPYNALIRNQLQTMGENIGRSIDIGKIDFSLLGSSDIDTLTLILKDGSEISMQNINFNIGIFSALLMNSVNGEMKINNIKYDKEKTTLNGVLSSDFNLKFVSFSEFPASGRIKLELQNITANGLTIKGFDIPSVRFTSIAADMNIAKKKISIDNFKAAGPDLKGNITGFVTVANFFPQSQLSLSIIIDSTSSFLANYKILLGKWIDDSNKIQLSVKGSISNPRADAMEQRTETSPRIDLPEQKKERKPRVNSFSKPQQMSPTPPVQGNDPDTN